MGCQELGNLFVSVILVHPILYVGNITSAYNLFSEARQLNGVAFVLINYVKVLNLYIIPKLAMSYHILFM